MLRHAPLALGLISATAVAAPAPPAPPAVVALVAGGDDTCARMADGGWRCWGEDRFGQLGADPHHEACGTVNTPARCLLRPTPLTGVDAFTTLALDGSTSCVLGEDHAIRCWGAATALGRGAGATLASCALDGVEGQVGTLDTTTGKLTVDPRGLHKVATTVPCSRTPAKVAGELAANALAIGDGFACAATKDGAACWGSDNDGRLDLPSDGLDRCAHGACALAPRPLPGVGALAALALGDESGAAITADGAVMTWGSRLGGQLGRPGDGAPAVVPSLTKVTQLALGSYFGCALIADGHVRCWGTGDDGNLGLGALPRDDNGLAIVAAPRTIPGLDHVQAIATSPAATHTCAIVGGGAVRCWGNNNAGQLGVGDVRNRLVPATVPRLSGVIALALGGRHTCALTKAGAVWCWGADQLGQLGAKATTTGRCKLGYLADPGTVPCALVPVRVDVR
jgi:hypothetical protein